MKEGGALIKKTADDYSQEGWGRYYLFIFTPMGLACKGSRKKNCLKIVYIG